MSIQIITLLMVAIFVVTLFAGVPLVFVLGAIGVIFTALLWGPHGLYIVSSLTWQLMSADTLIAVPLFILMGNILQRSGIADDLYETVYKWSGRVNGGLAIGTIVICAFFGAMSGVAGAATVSLGLIALPSMRKRGYNAMMSVGPIAGGGTLGILIPPSVPIIFYGLYARESVGQLFLAGILPGIVMAVLFMIYIYIMGRIQPESCPAIPLEDRASWEEKIKSLTKIIPVLILIILVLGSIFTGMATPTESASVGVLGAFVISLIKGRVNNTFLKECTISTVSVTSMVLWVMIGAAVFAGVYQALGASDLLLKLTTQEASGSIIHKWIVFAIVVSILFMLGMFIDAGAIVILIVPTVVPLMVLLGFDPIWFSIVFIVMIMIGYLSPPFGLSLFYMRGVAPKDISTGDIYKSVLPYIAVLFIGIMILIAFPDLATWLPRIVMAQ